MINLKKIIIPVILSITVCLQAQIPERPNPPRLLNDFAGILATQQVRSLEDSLDNFSRTTSNQIAVLIVDDLNGLSASDFAYQVGEKWGVGQSQFNNGMVVLVKVKNETGGEAFIATGYGLEAVLPDATCKRIIENEMIPAFRENDYYLGIVNALNVIMPIAKGEFSHEDYGSDDVSPVVGIIAILVFLSLVVLLGIIANKHKGDDFTGKNGGHKGMSPTTAFILGSMLGSGGRSGGSFGGSGGGFGGFGGGSFGGGGAGGRW